MNHSTFTFLFVSVFFFFSPSYSVRPHYPFIESHRFTIIIGRGRRRLLQKPKIDRFNQMTMTMTISYILYMKSFSRSSYQQNYIETYKHTRTNNIEIISIFYSCCPFVSLVNEFLMLMGDG